MGGVLEQKEGVIAAPGGDGVDAGDDETGYVNGDYAPGARGEQSFDLGRAAAERRRVEVGEYRGSPGENHGVGGGGEGVGRHDHFAPLDAEMPQGGLEGCRAGAHADGVGDPHVLGKLPFEAVEELPLCEPAAAQDLAEILEEAVDVGGRQAGAALVDPVSQMRLVCLRCKPSGRLRQGHRDGARTPDSGGLQTGKLL